MSLGGRELLLVIRSRDLVTRDLERISGNLAAIQGQSVTTQQKLMGAASAFTAAGVGMAAVGAVGISFFNNAIEVAKKYNQQVALTATQAQDVNVSFKQLADMGRDVGKDVPVAFDQIQDGLYDIFSSIDVNAPQAKKLLDAFARGAVAGQVEMQDASTASIAIMNAFKIPVKDVNKVMDMQFQLVAKGVGTYADFSGAIGRSIPSAVKAGQSFETLAGMLSFLTRNGLSAQMASTSAARALDAMVNPKVVENMEDIGVAMYDTKGKARPLIDVLHDLGDKMKNMTQKEKVGFLTQLFKGGGGTIQAMRFFNLAFKNMDDLDLRMDEMKDSAGSMGRAYDMMFKQPQSQVQLLSNKYKIMQTEIGDKLIPYKLKLVDAGLKVLEMWNSLSPKTQDMIVKGLALASAFFVVTGVVLVFIGVGLGLVALMMAVGLSFGAALVAMVAIPAAIAAIIAGIVLLVGNWDDAKAKGKEVWEDLKKGINDAKVILDKFVQQVEGEATHVWETAKDAVEKYIKMVKRIVGLTKDIGSDIWEGFKDQGVFKDIQTSFNTLKEKAGPTFNKVIDALKTMFDFFVWVFEALIGVMNFFITKAQQFWDAFGSKIVDVIVAMAKNVVGVFTAFAKVVLDIISLIADILTGHWGDAWDDIKQLAEDAVGLVVAIVSGFWKTLIAIFKLGWSLLAAGVRLGWDLIVSFMKTFFKAIITIFFGVPNWLHDSGLKLIHGLWRGIQDKWVAVKAWLGNVKSGAKAIFHDAMDWLKNIGKQIFQGLWNGIKEKWEDIKNWLGNVGGWIKDLKGPPATDAVILFNNGQLIMEGFHAGLKDGWGKVSTWLDTIAPEVQGSFDVGTSTSGGFGSGASALGSSRVVQLSLAPGAVTISGTNAEESAKAVNDTLRDLILELTRS